MRNVLTVIIQQCIWSHLNIQNWQLSENFEYSKHFPFIHANGMAARKIKCRNLNFKDWKPLSHTDWFCLIYKHQFTELALLTHWLLSIRLTQFYVRYPCHCSTLNIQIELRSFCVFTIQDHTRNAYLTETKMCWIFKIQSPILKSLKYDDYKN